MESLNGELFACNDDSRWYELLSTFHVDFGGPILLVAFLASFVLSFAVGANDSANSWGTSVGAGTVSLGWAYFLGSACETLGAVFLSGNVIKKLTSGIVNVEAYTSNCTEEIDHFAADEAYLSGEMHLLVGCIAVMVGSSLWQLVASFLGWPVSGSHSIVSGLLGFTLAARPGATGVKDWDAIRDIAVGWVLSPMAAALATATLYYPLYRWCIRSQNPASTKNRLVYSLLVWLAVGFNFVNIFITGSTFLDLTPWDETDAKDIPKADADFNKMMEKIYWSGIAFSIGIPFGLAFFFMVPTLVRLEADFALTCGCLINNRIARKYLGESSSSSATSQKAQAEQPTVILKSVNGHEPTSVKFADAEAAAAGPQDLGGQHCMASSANDLLMVDEVDGDDSPEVKRIFRPLQVLSACTGALAHGGNDVGNCIGPLVLIYHVFETGIIDSENVSAPPLLALYGGFGISMGLIMFGKRVIRTMGSEISKMTPSRGFCVEWMAAVVVLIVGVNKQLGLPVSTTHCQVGGLMGAGIARGLVEKGFNRSAFQFINFRLLSGIVMSWVATIPFVMLFTCVFYWMLVAVLF